MTPLVSIIVLNYKTQNLLRQFLQTVQSLKFDFVFEIIAVDNASCDGSAEMVKEEFPNVTCIVSSENRGFAYGMNLGMRSARGKYFFLLNPDIILLDNSLQELVDFMEKNPKVGIAAPKLLNPDRSLQMSCMRFPKWYTPLMRRTPLGKTAFGQKHLNSYMMHDWDHQEIQEVDWFIGAAMLVRREANDGVKGMDERFFLYLEDTDYCRQFWEKGWKASYIASVSVVHYHKRESAGSAFKFLSYPTRLHTKSFVQYLWKYRGRSNPRM